MRNAVRFLIASLFMTANCFAGVTISSPAPGSTSASPVHFVASASSGSPITAMRIYVDDNSVYLTLSNQLDTFVSMGAGTHSVVVQAWDSTGAVLKTPETVTITAGGTVSVSSPANGATVSSPFQVVAAASAPNPVTAMQIYLDNQLVFTAAGANLNTAVSAGAGSHLLVVQAWDSTGAVYKQPITITITSSIPSNAIVKSKIEEMSGWQNCTVCAGSGGSGPVAGFSMNQFQASPSLDGSSAQFNIWGSTPYSDALWWKQLGGDNSISNFQYDVNFYLTAPQNAQALEFDVNQSNGSMKFIFGTQCNIRNGGVWDVWDTAGHTWRSTGIACSAPAAFQWHHLTWQFRRTSTQTIFVSLTLDGVTHYVNQTFNAIPVNASEINVAFQMDGDFAQHPYSVWLDEVTLSYW